jgi:hypothetical protein
MSKGWISPWAFYNSDTGVYESADYNPKGSDAPTWTFPSEDATLLYEDGSGDIPISGIIKKGTYASPADLGSSTVIGFLSMWGSGSGSDTFIIGTQFFVKTTESARPFPLCVQAEIDNDGVSYPDRGQAAQFIILLGGGGESSKLGALGGDATAGMYATWHKVGANVNCSTEAGCRVAPIWIDNQMNCVVNGEEYAAFITCGGSKVDAVFGFETTSSGWTQLFYFDETAYDQDPISSNYFKVLLNATQLYIPTSTTAGSFTGTLGAVTVTGQMTFTTGDIHMGSYASPVDLGSSTTIGFSQWWGSGSGSDTFIIGQQLFVKTTESARPFPLCVQAEINNDGSTYPDRGQAAQFIILLGGGGESSKLGAKGDATAGMFAGWFKVGANVNCSTEADAMVAPLWIDNQMNCIINGEEYAAFITCGGSKVDAVFGFETTSSGWSYLFLFDETAYDQDPVGTGNITGGDKDYYLKCLLNGVAYGIQLYEL